MCLATLFQYRYRTGLVAKQYGDVTQSRHHVILQGQDENPQLNEVVGHFNCCITSELNFRTMFYIFDHFKLSWDPPNMIFDPSESSHDLCVHLRPPHTEIQMGRLWHFQSRFVASDTWVPLKYWNTRICIFIYYMRGYPSIILSYFFYLFHLVRKSATYLLDPNYLNSSVQVPFPNFQVLENVGP